MTGKGGMSPEAAEAVCAKEWANNAKKQKHYQRVLAQARATLAAAERDRQRRRKRWRRVKADALAALRR
jgi:hypothetical protein